MIITLSAYIKILEHTPVTNLDQSLVKIWAKSGQNWPNLAKKKKIGKEYLSRWDVHIGQPKISLIFSSFVHLLANKPMAKRSKASGASAGGLWVKNRSKKNLFKFFKIV